MTRVSNTAGGYVAPTNCSPPPCQVVWRYVMAMGGPMVLAVLMALYALVELSRVAASAWISLWTGDVQAERPSHGTAYYVAGYSLICLVQVLFSFGNQFWLVSASRGMI